MGPLFKIKPIIQQNIDSIKNDEIWLPKVLTLNDPYDCAIKPYLREDLEKGDLMDSLEELGLVSQLFGHVNSIKYDDFESVAVMNFDIHEAVCEQFKNIGVCSFLQSPFNIVTWSHYGDQHKGMCLEFEVDDSIEACMQRAFTGYRICPVSYNNLMPELTWSEFLKAPELALALCLATKYKDWAYEDEVRLICYEEEGDRAVNLAEIGFSLRKVYLGSGVEESETVEELREVCDNKGVEVAYLRRKSQSYALCSEADIPVDSSGC